MKKSPVKITLKKEDASVHGEIYCVVKIVGQITVETRDNPDVAVGTKLSKKDAESLLRHTCYQVTVIQ